MAGRTQCEGYQLHKDASSTSTEVALGLTAIAAALAKRGLIKPAAVVEGIAIAVEQIDYAYKDKTDRLEAGCNLEKKRDALVNAGVGASTIYYPTDKIVCGEIFIPAPPATGSDDGTIVVNGGRFKVVCSPIVLDLGGDGIHYRPITAVSGTQY